jgi:DNA mismatch repair protein MutS2
VAERAEAAAAVHAQASEPEAESTAPVDWQHARPGDAVFVQGAGPATLDALPDRRGRAAVRVGSARLVVPAERIRAPGAAPARPEPRRRTPALAARPALGGGTTWCDLRGLRVEEALERAIVTLDRAASEGRDRVSIVHGLGTGALRDAVRDYLRGSPYAVRFAAGSPEEGGDGVTLVDLRD